jgi:hypothetical protein
MPTRLVLKVENVFEITGRGCVLLPFIPEGRDFMIRPKDRIQLRTPSGAVLDTHIAAIELAKPRDGGPCRMAITLPLNFVKGDVPTGTEIWFLDHNE